MANVKKKDEEVKTGIKPSANKAEEKRWKMIRCRVTDKNGTNKQKCVMKDKDGNIVKFWYNMNEWVEIPYNEIKKLTRDIYEPAPFVANDPFGRDKPPVRREPRFLIEYDVETMI